MVVSGYYDFQSKYSDMLKESLHTFKPKMIKWIIIRLQTSLHDGSIKRNMASLTVCVKSVVKRLLLFRITHYLSSVKRKPIFLTYAKTKTQIRCAVLLCS